MATPASMVRRMVGVAGILSVVGWLSAAEVFYRLPLNELTITEGTPPWVADEDGGLPHRIRNVTRSLFPYAVGGPGVEVYVGVMEPVRNHPISLRGLGAEGIGRQLYLAARVADGAQPANGRLFVPNSAWTGQVPLAFELVGEAGRTADARDEFFQAKRMHYERLAAADIPGGAWFRHQLLRAELEREGENATLESALPAAQEAEVSFRQRRREMDAYQLFSGGRAISENLQLDRVWELGPKDGEEEVPLDQVPGIATAAIDWKPLIAGKTPALDPLAAGIPEDQHALFFPSFQAMLTMLDEAAANGTPVLRLFEPRAEDARTRQRYESQMCLDLDDLARQFGPRLIASVAFTGSDPYLRTGSDVAVLFETPQPAALATLLAARQAAALQAHADGEPKTGVLAGMAYQGVRTPSRRLAAYLARSGNVVVVSNSTVQLGIVLETLQGTRPSLARSDEYVFFRDRYVRGGDETALLVLTDETIRRWCSPEWRIGAARRTRAAAVMAELQARALGQGDAGHPPPGVVTLADAPPDLGELRINEAGRIVSSVYGDSGFLTPIREMGLVRATRREVEMYDFFRSRYEREWRQVFDPIGIQFSVRAERLAADVTVRPLIGSSDYREFMATVGQVGLPANAGDPHPESIAHMVMALDKDAANIREIGSMGRSMVPGIQGNPLGWLGKWVALYFDRDPFWEEMLEEMEKGEEAMEGFMERNIWNLPVALVVDVENGFVLAGFLTALRGFVEQASPGMVLWETRTHGEEPYVRLSPSQRGRRMLLDEEEGEPIDLALYYANTGRSLIFSLREDLVQRHLDRLAAPVPAPDWEGNSMAAHFGNQGISLVRTILRESVPAEFQTRSWANLPILNEWARRFRPEDALALHEAYWDVRLVCPLGGEYVWDEEFQTFSSTVAGHPGRPAAPPAPTRLPPAMERIRDIRFGLTFEEDGLRANGVLDRAAGNP